MAFYSRGKNKIQNPYNLSDMYKEYIENRRGNKVYDIDGSTFIKICERFYSEVRDGILDGNVFKMPYGLGEIEITKRKIEHYMCSDRAVDWKTTLEIGKKVYHLNEHTNGYNYGIDWANAYRVANKNSYRFVPTRYFKRTLANIVKNKEQDYYERS